MATLKSELKRLRKGQFREKEEREAIDKFITNRLRQEAKNGKNSADFSITGNETIKNPANGEVIHIKKADYIRFAFRHRLRYAIYIDLHYKEQDKIVLFF